MQCEDERGIEDPGFRSQCKYLTDVAILELTDALKVACVAVDRTLEGSQQCD